MTLRVEKVRLESGRELSALDIQREYLDCALKFADTHGFSPTEMQALEMWEHCVSTIENDPLKLGTEVDWVIKHNLIEAFRSKHDLALDDARVATLDLQYHDIRRDRGVFYRMQDRNLVERICVEDDITSAMDKAPQTTRARLRSEFITAAKEKSVTTRSIGFISRSMIKHNARCSAKTRLKVKTIGSKNSSHRSSQALLRLPLQTDEF